MTDRSAPVAARMSGSEREVAAAGTVASLTALFSATACCVLPLALASIGIGAGGLAVLVPYKGPLTVVALAVVIVGWGLYLRKRRTCSADADCAASAPSRATLAMLIIASVLVAICLLWSFIEQPLMRALGGA